MRHVFEELFADAGTRLEDHVTLHADTILARHWWPDGSSLDLHADPGLSATAIRDFAGPKAEREFRRFSDKARRLFEAFDAPVMQEPAPKLGALTAHVMKTPALIPAMAPGLTLAQKLRLQFSDPRLQQLFGRYATYVGGSPYLSPAILGLIWHSEARGVWAIEGGMHRLAEALHGLAVERGVRFRFDARADRIELQGGRCTSVIWRTVLGCGPIPCCSTATPRHSMTGCSGPDRVRPCPSAPWRSGACRPSSGALPAEAVGVDLAHHNVFFCVDPKVEFGDIAKGRMPRDATLYVCAQDRGGTARPEGPERFEIIMNGPPGHKATDEERETCRTRTFASLEKMGLRFSPVPDDRHLTTPADFDRDFPASDGSLYGRSPHGMMATFHRPGGADDDRGALPLRGAGPIRGRGSPWPASPASTRPRRS